MNKLKGIIITSFLALSSSVFAAKNIGDTATAIGTQISSVTNMMILGGTLLGIVFLIIGGLNLKKHGDNPQQVPLSRPLIFLGAGALLFGLGSTSDVMQQSLFGGGRDSGGEAGQFNDFTK
ncbi:hypothetical protein H5404_17930 [Vibrio parahaemolyticus]|uniref:Type IV secretion protein IcmD n=2 Tax=Vibrio TaxID=662 RepID=A0AAU9QYE5_9VIBR|nr:DUF6750 family protein [Vibrio parahaemolyticus]QNE57701.1 hypothetical protein H5404_17930 [Vibrio parahaemolyticus]CAH1558567.1 conserved membrane hypothetical protein [Vibrio jasicida]CAH1604004.1 conserved membrane hypothetical protein [Vibrio jasicida]